MNRLAPSTAVAVVLGAAVLPGERASPTLDRRARHAAQLCLEGAVGAIIASGGIGKHPPSEAEMIRRICVDMGVPAATLHLEDRSATTAENLAFARPILSRLGATAVVIVTDRYHAPRALLAARRLGISTTASCPNPTGTPPLRILRQYLREIPAFLWYLVRPVGRL